MPTQLDTLRGPLDAIGQGHVLAHWAQLTATQQARLVDDLQALDLAWVAELAEQVRAPKPPQAAGAAPKPPPTVAITPALVAAGEALLRAGQVAAFVVAGGQGTRLGHPGPKGTFPATPVTGKPLFQVFAEQIAAVGQRYGVTVPWYVMTSPQNDAETRVFFRAHGYFGLPQADVVFFPQGTLPTFGPDGRLLLAGPDRLATNPDGHGGSLTALVRSGALADMRARGVTQIAYFQVDNPLAQPLDPGFLGAHAAAAASSGEMTSKAVRKVAPDERVGVFAQIDGRTQVVEYSDLSPAQAAARRPDGRLVLDAGNVAVHALSVAFVEHLTAGGRADLPLHRAHKRQPVYDPSVGAVAEAAVVKFEQFVFDALPRCAASAVIEVARADEFAPIKNAEGADSPATSRQLQSERAAAWLAAAGVAVPRDAGGALLCTLEIAAATALDAAALAGQPLPDHIPPGATLAL